MAKTEQEILEQDAEESRRAAEAEPATTDYIEYLGDPTHGTAFLTAHTIRKGDPVWKRNGVEDAKDLTWERDPNVPVGQKSRMLLRTDNLSAGQLEVLEKTTGYRRVSE